MGSSIVTMCLRVVWLMWPTIAASVEVLPEPVMPVTRMSPRSSAAIFFTIGGRPSWSRVGTLKGIARSTAARFPFCRNTEARKRPTPSSA